MNAPRPTRNRRTRHARLYRDTTGQERVAHGYLVSPTVFELDREDWWAIHPDVTDLGQAPVTVPRRRLSLTAPAGKATHPAGGER